MKIGYMSGPVDGLKVIEDWRAGRQTDYFGTSYLMEFLDVSRDLCVDPVVLTYRGEEGAYRKQIDNIALYQVKRWPLPGLGYHLEAIWKVLKSIRILLRERVSVVVVTEGAENGWLLAPLRWFGISLLPALHGQLWSRFVPIRRSHRPFHWLNQRFFYRGPFLAASGDIAGQVDAPARVFMPTYPPFSIPPPPKGGPFIILSAGRIEEDKGVFDLLAVARLLVKRGLDFEMHFCGEGTEMERFRRESAGLPIVIHGFCGRAKLMEMFAKSHAVVVATQSKLSEGFAMICAEGVLAGRPVVTSRVCPALEYIRDAAIEVEPDHIEGYADAFASLMLNKELYDAKVKATAPLRSQFLDPVHGYGAALRSALLELRPELANASDQPLSERLDGVEADVRLRHRGHSA